MLHNKKVRKGFTLVEMLVVVVIIGILATLIAMNMITAQARGRDSKRKGDVALIRGAAQMYRDDAGTYNIKFKTSTGALVGTGYTATSGVGGTSEGWFNREDGSGYVHSIASGLVSGGYLTSIPKDPQYDITSAADNDYMYYWSNITSLPDEAQVYAKLEKPSSSDEGTCFILEVNKCNYGMNYMINAKKTQF